MSNTEENADDPVQSALKAIKPRTIAAKLRDYLPLIDDKIQAGARIDEILAALSSAGMEVKENTLKSNLQRYRKKQQSAKPKAPAAPAKPSAGQAETVSVNQFLRPDSEKQDADMANYERLGRQQAFKKLQSKTPNEEK